MDKLKVLDLFSGIGAFTLGMQNTGLYETVAFCEWDTPCQKVLKKHFPKVPIYEDIKSLEGHPYGLYSEENGLAYLGDIDVITGGFPCQDISVAKRNAEGIEGERSGHWKHFARLIEELRPKGVIIENVSALRRRGLGVILSDLHKIGYDAEWHCITAKHFGATHERDRLFILAYPISVGGQGFKPLQHLEKVGQWLQSCKEDLQQVYSNPFGRSGRIPQPLLRGMDVRSAGRVDRLKQIGNSVYHPIVTRLGKHLYDNIIRMERHE